MVGRWSFHFGMPFFHVLNVSFREGRCLLMMDEMAMSRPSLLVGRSFFGREGRWGGFRGMSLGMVDFSSHTFSAFWLWSSVVSVLISVTTDMSPTGRIVKNRHTVLNGDCHLFWRQGLWAKHGMLGIHMPFFWQLQASSGNLYANYNSGNVHC